MLDSETTLPRMKPCASAFALLPEASDSLLPCGELSHAAAAAVLQPLASSYSARPSIFLPHFPVQTSLLLWKVQYSSQSAGIVVACAFECSSTDASHLAEKLHWQIPTYQDQSCGNPEYSTKSNPRMNGEEIEVHITEYGYSYSKKNYVLHARHFEAVNFHAQKELNCTT